MFSKLTCVFLFVIVAILLHSDAYAWDGKRKGLVIETGFGLGGSYFYSNAGDGSNTAFRVGPAYSNKVGYAWNDREMVFIGWKMSMAYFDRIVDSYDSYFDAMGDGGIKGTLAIIAAPFALVMIPMGGSHSVAGVFGLTYYFNDSAPSYFIEGSLGAGIIPDEFQDETVGGFGLSLSGGYEFTQHWNFRGDLLIGIRKEEASESYPYDYPESLESSDSPESNVALSLACTINWMIY
jgi:hypothetical protein